MRLMAGRFAAWLVLLCLVWNGATASQPTQEKKVYQFGVFAYKGEERTREEFAPIINAINRKLVWEKLELHVLNQAQIYQGLQTKTLDFVVTNPTHFLVARQRYEVTGALATLVKNNDGYPGKSLGGTIIARADNHQVNNLTQLRGKTIAAPGSEYMGGYRAQMYELHLAGVSLAPEQIKFVGSHRAAVDAVINGEVDAGFVRDGILEAMTRRNWLDIKQLKVINVQYRPDFPHLISTRLYPEWPLFALPHVSDMAKRHIAAALLAIDFNEIGDANSAIYGFTVPSDYLAVETLSRDLRLPPFEQREAITWSDLVAEYGTAITWALVFLFALLTSLMFLLVWIKKARAATLYSRELLATQDELVLVNNGEELVDVSGGFLKFFAGSYDSLAAFKQDYRCICDLFVKQEGYLFNYQAMQWIEKLVLEPENQHKAIVNFQGRHTYFKCTGVYSHKLGLYLVTMVDITELETTNRRLVEQTRIAEHANQTKSNFLANMSHEIRTPMNGILGLSELGLQAQTLEQAYQRLQKIHYSGRLLLGIINDILDLSKIEAGRLSLDSHAFVLVALLEDIIELYRPQAQSKGVILSLECDNNLALGYVGDDLRLRQVLTNLIGNAVKFTEQGAVTLRVCLQADTPHEAPHQAWLKFEVQDTGKGVSLEQQQRLFKPFAQADDSITRQYGGTGLGLVICDKLVQLMGGEQIQLQSELGQGSVFSFSVPLMQLSEQQQDALQREQSDHLNVKLLQEGSLRFNAKVLLVEDNEINQEVAAELLKQLGVSYDLAMNGEQAVTKAQDHDYDLILMDIQMPILDGYQATRRIRQFNAQLPIIALTAAAMIEDKEKALSAGMNDHLSKPIDKAVLRECLCRWLPSHEIQNEQTEVVLIAHPDSKVLKNLAQTYREKGPVRVANSLEKVHQILQVQAEISRLVLAAQWAQEQAVLAQTYGVEIKIDH